MKGTNLSQEELSSLFVKYADCLTEDVIKHYASVYKLSRDEAKKKLVLSFENEEESVSPRAISLKAMKGIRLLAPTVEGLKNRVRDQDFYINELQNKISSLSSELTLHKETLQSALKLIKNNVVPSGFWNKLKWLMKR